MQSRWADSRAGGAAIAPDLSQRERLRPVDLHFFCDSHGNGQRQTHGILAGGGAAVGALIGGLAGGGKGAGIGALAGGGAGTGGAAFTGNKDVVLPAESALSFKLEQPLEVK